MRKLLSFVFVVMLGFSCLTLSSAAAEDDVTILYSIPAVSNPYEQTLRTFTLSYCLPAQMLNQTPVITDGQEDPNGLTWVIFVKDDGVVQLTGKDSQGNWKCATWSDVDKTEMLFLCYCLSKSFGPVYKDNTDFAICLYSSSGNHSYIANKESAESFIELIDKEYGGTVENTSQTVRRTIYGTGYSIELPSEWLYGDFDVKDDAPLVKQLGINAKTFTGLLQMDGTCFYALSDDHLTSLQLAMSDSSQNNYTEMPVDDLKLLVDMYANALSDDFTVKSTDVVDLNYRYLEVVLYRSSDNSNHVDFVTVNNGKIFTFTMECHSPDFEGFEKQLREILKTFRADK